jgi:hypothetical protein
MIEAWGLMLASEEWKREAQRTLTVVESVERWLDLRKNGRQPDGG